MTHWIGETVDFLVDVGNPAALDVTLGQLGAHLLRPGGDQFTRVDGHYVMRTFGNPDFVRWACEQQGYCRVVQQLARQVDVLPEPVDDAE